MATEQPRLRQARLDEAEGIDALMKASPADIFPAFYNAEQTAASVRYISSVDRTLIEDGTYFVVEADGELVACAGATSCTPVRAMRPVMP